MPPTNQPVLRAADLRLVHACVRIARCKIQKTFTDATCLDPRMQDALQTVSQAEAVLQREMCKHNLVPAASAQELRDEDLADDDIPLF